MASARVGLGRRFQLWLIGRLRRSRFLPSGIPDKLTDEARLGQPLGKPVIVYFATTLDSLYQVRPWFPALKALDTEHPLVFVCKDSRVADVIRRESGLDALTLARYGQLDEILSLSEVKLALYINHDPVNFECLRFTSLVHVYLGHGDSDKGVSASNQVKAYDFCFLAGQAALDRTAASLMLYDAAGRSVLIGQPQLDAPSLVPHPDPERRTVLYAPTWESSQPSVSYGSVARQGERIVEALKSTYRVIYRPHPLNGVIDSAYAAADARLRELADRVDTDLPIEQSFADADLLITDVSAVPLSWLPSGKPLVVTVPEVPLPPSPALAVLPRLSASHDVAAVVAEHLDADPTAEARREVVEHYFGDTTPGVATARFVAACDDAMTLRDREWAAAQDRGATGP